jgi:glycine cleavage system aminomethyltransferase T
MNNEQLYDDAREVLDMLAALHQQTSQTIRGFGAWVMKQYYPEISDSVLVNCEDESMVRSLMLTRWAAGRLDFSRVSHLCAKGESAVVSREPKHQ